MRRPSPFGRASRARAAAAPAFFDPVGPLASNHLDTMRRRFGTRKKQGAGVGTNEKETTFSRARFAARGSRSPSPRVPTSVDARAGDGETEEDGAPTPPAPAVKSDPFGFGTSTGEPDKIMPGFDTAEGGKVGPVGTFFISALLVLLFGPRARLNL